MNKRLLIFGVSLVANVLLAAFLLRSPASPAKESAANDSPLASSAKKKKHRTNNSPAETSAATETQAETNALPQFNWAQLETSDYKEYVERLRAFGVPERTVRDIVIADIQRLYRPKFAALRPPKKPENPNFWENRNWYGSYSKMSKEQREQLRALTKEQKELIQSLLGKDVYLEIAKDSGEPDWTGQMFGAIPAEHREQMEEIQERFNTAQSEIYAKADGYIDQDVQKELKAIRRKMQQEMAAFLSPEQIEAYELQNSEISQNMRWELRSFEPNEQEFRSIFKLKEAEEKMRLAALDANGEERDLTKEERKTLEAQRQEFKTALKEALGPERMKEYELMNDWSYRNLFESGVSKESILKVPDIKKDAQAAAKKIQADKTLTKEQRTAALSSIKTETQNTLTELLGARQAKAYTRNGGGWWLQNMAGGSPQFE